MCTSWPQKPVNFTLYGKKDFVDVLNNNLRWGVYPELSQKPC